MTDGYRELPLPASTSAERLAALKEAKTLTQASGFVGALGMEGGIMSMLRLAEYITLGHDYLDTHPQPEIVEVMEEETQELEGLQDD